MESHALDYSGDREIIAGFMPACRGFHDWKPAVRPPRSGSPGTVVRRVIWNSTGDPNRRVLIDVADAVTGEAARARLLRATHDGNLPFAGGPPELGLDSLVHPKTGPRSMHFRRANLAIWILSYGSESVDLMPWALQILNELEPDQAQARHGLVFEPESRGGDGRLMYLRFSVPWDRGPGAWWKFTTEDGGLARSEDGDHVIVSTRPGGKPPVVSGWAIEPGRETYWGQFPAPGA